MKKLLSLLLTFAVLLSLTACAGKSEKSYSKDFVDLFDTASKITAYDSSQASFDEHFELVYSMLNRYSKMLDIYNVYDDVVSLKQVNDSGANNPVEVDKELIEIIDYGKKVYSLTDGRVNIAMGSVLSIWHSFRENGLKNPENASVPSKDMLKQAAQYTDIDSITIDYDNNTVTLKNPNVSIDIGAIAKGFVCDKIAEYIKVNSIWDSAVISLGGNVKVIGTKKGKPFNIAVENPIADNYLAELKVTDEDSVVTSGGYQRYYTVNDKRYCHIIDRDTLMPADYFESVTVISTGSALADAMSTALFTLSIDKGRALVDEVNNNEKLAEIFVIWLDSNGEITYSDNFEGTYL